MTKTNAISISRPAFPDSGRFFDVCSRGLSAMYEYTSTVLPDPYGWKYGKAEMPSHWAYGRLRNILTIAAIEPLKPKSMLEVAAGGGSLSTYMARNGTRVVANDLRADVLRSSLAEYVGGEAVEVCEGNIFDVDAAKIGQFDLVVACEVIEHVAHADQFLAKLKSFCRPGGMVFITTPNGRYFRNSLPTYDQIEDFSALEKDQFKPDADGHLFLFTPAELARVAHQAGLTVESLQCWGTPLLTGHAGFRFLGRMLPRSLLWRLETATSSLPSKFQEQSAFCLFALLRA